MARTPSVMTELGMTAPSFSLPDTVSGVRINSPAPGDYNATVIMFICNHCPYVKHINHELTKLASDYIPLDICFIAINSNDITNYPDDAPDKMHDTALAEGYPFPYLFDESQDVAKAYQAACTPDFFVYDSNMKLAYRGQLDDSRPGNNTPVSGFSIRHALDCLLENRPVSSKQIPSLGCNIKWKVEAY